MKNLLIITGASRGIGKATAKLFLENQYDIINLSRTPCAIDKVQNFSFDLSSFDSLPFQLSEYDNICIVHNAASLYKDNIENLTVSSMRDVFEVNVIAPLKLNQLIIPKIKKGSIIYIGSTLSEIAVPGAASYVTSKHALAGLMKSTCQDLAGKGIHTALICPGFTETEMLKKHLNNDQSILDSVAQGNGFGRLINPSEIAEMIYFAANNPVVNGSILHGNLGQKN